MKLTKNEVKEIALRFVSEQDLHGFKMEFVETNKRVRYPDEWVAVFDVYSAKGELIDGPSLIIIDEKTGEARSFESA
jgi:hypothetical protein